MPKQRIPGLPGVVEKRSMPGRSLTGKWGGLHGSDYADMSSEKARENRARRNPKVSWGRFVHPGLVGPLAEAERRR